MAQRLTIKQENFCRKYVEYDNAAKAYREAYDAENMKNETIYKRAHELLSDGKIAGMVDSLKEEAKKEHKITIEYIRKGFEEAINMARSREETANLIKGFEAMAKLYGLNKEKEEKVETRLLEKQQDIVLRFLEREKEKKELIDVTPEGEK